MQVELTRGLFSEIDSIDSDLNSLSWQAMKMRDKFYAGRSVNLGNKKIKTILMHRVILSRMLERDLTKGEEVDHKDRNPLNNKRENLRLANGTQNNFNKPSPRNITGFKGVSFDKNKKTKPYASHIGFEGKRLYLGYFDTPEEAYDAYCTKLKELAGEFANFDIELKKVPDSQP